MTSPSGSRTIPARAMQVLSDFATVGRFEMAIDSTALDGARIATHWDSSPASSRPIRFAQLNSAHSAHLVQVRRLSAAQRLG